MKVVPAILKLVRIPNLAIIALSLYFFYYFIVIPVHYDKLHTTLLPLTNFEFALFVISIVFVAAAGNIINDYFDFELDRAYKQNRPLASGAISLDNAMYLHAALALTGIGIGFYLGWRNSNYKIGYIYVICCLALYLYSAYLKKVPLAGNIVVAALTGFVFVLLMIFEANFLNTISFEGAGYAFNILLSQLKFYAGFAFLTNLVREIVKDMEDVEGDKAYKINTLAVQYGLTAAKVSAVIVLLVLLIGLAFLMRGFSTAHAWKEFIYLGLAVILPVLVSILILVRAKAKPDYGRVSMLLKIIMLLGIFSIPAFYLFNK